jgi:hypothetical protein
MILSLRGKVVWSWDWEHHSGLAQERLEVRKLREWVHVWASMEMSEWYRNLSLVQTD